MVRTGTTIDFSKLKQGKSREKRKGAGFHTDIVVGKRTKGGITLQRSGNTKGNPKAAFDEFGLPRASKYAALGVRCRENVAIALREGFQYQGTSATTEEQVCYGELRRRGFQLGLGSASWSFQPQSPIAGSIVDFEVWQGGERIGLRPMNIYWHGHEDRINHDDALGEQILAAGYTLHDIWSGDSLLDWPLEMKFTQFFGPY